MTDQTVGRGSFSKVYLAQKKSSCRLYAIKKIAKSRLDTEEKEACALNERLVLEAADSQFIVRFYSSFQTSKCLFYVIQYAPGGELFKYLKKLRFFSEPIAQLCCAEVILALEHLHSKNIVYADLKPENILVSQDGHILLTDFGLSRFKTARAAKFGTDEYSAPEQLLGLDSQEAVDLWALVS